MGGVPGQRLPAPPLHFPLLYLTPPRSLHRHELSQAGSLVPVLWKKGGGTLKWLRPGREGPWLLICIPSMHSKPSAPPLIQPGLQPLCDTVPQPLLRESGAQPLLKKTRSDAP